MVTINHNMSSIQFEAEIRKWALVNVPKIGKEIHAAVTEAIYEGIVVKTPVLTGRARFNWFPTTGTPSPLKVEETANVSSTGAPVTGEEKGRIRSVTAKLKAVPLGQETAYITNNQPYIVGLEDGTISRKVAPNAMVQGTIINTLDGLKVSIGTIGVD